MAESQKYNAVKRFGVRYGRTLKERFGKVELEQRKRQKCPYCSALKVKRIAVGIWGCRKCGAKFTGKAYSITQKITFEKEKRTDIPKESKEEIEEAKEVS